jgi:hypothetical protein
MTVLNNLEAFYAEIIQRHTLNFYCKVSEE